MKTTHLLRGAPLTGLALALLAGAASAQTAAFKTPGMPLNPTFDQASRFTRDYNPSFGFLVEMFADYSDLEEEDDGVELNFRLGEITINAWVDPSAWCYGVVVFDGEETALEEGAVHYVGFGGNTTVRAGRFFVDFGKQMQAHVHDIRTFDRPAVLAEYLGEELAGEGVQFDNWHTFGDSTVVRYSIGVFNSLIAEHGHGEEEEEGEPEPEAEIEARKDFDELGITGRLTGFTDVGQQGTLQIGASVRHIPDFAFHDEENDLEVDGLSNTVWGLDLTYGWADDTNTERFICGGEFLCYSGDIAGEFEGGDPPTGIEVVDDDVNGYYAFADYGWNQFNFVGFQISSLETAHDGQDLDQYDLYYTHFLSEFQRLRFSAIRTELEDIEETRFVIQYTNYLGAHAHGLNF